MWSEVWWLRKFKSSYMSLYDLWCYWNIYSEAHPHIDIVEHYIFDVIKYNYDIYIKVKSYTHRGEIEIILDVKIIFDDNLDMLLENVNWWALISETYGDIIDSVDSLHTLMIQWNAKLLKICDGDIKKSI